MTYTPETVAHLLPAALDATATKAVADPTAPVYRSRCTHCAPGRDSCAHRCDLDQWDEGCISSFEGEEFGICRHVHNGRRPGRCGHCRCFSSHDRRPSVNVKTASNTVVAAIVDVRHAWQEAPLLDLHRRRLVMRYGLDWGQAEIAEEEGASQQAVSKSIKSGLKILADHLNGEI